MNQQQGFYLYEQNKKRQTRQSEQLNPKFHGHFFEEEFIREKKAAVHQPKDLSWKDF